MEPDFDDGRRMMIALLAGTLLILSTLLPAWARAESQASPREVAGGDQRRTHRVARGETLWSIAAAEGITVEALLEANPEVEDADHILADWTLRLPAAAPTAPPEEPVEAPTCETVAAAGVEDITLPPPAPEPGPGALAEAGQAPAEPAAEAAAPSPREAPEGGGEEGAGEERLAYGGLVSAELRRAVREVADRLDMNPNHLMAIMHYETGGSFRPSIRNPRTGATGLIQFLPSTARRLGTTVEALAAMSAVEQMDWVERYLSYFRGRLGTLEDAYMAVLYPVAVGEPSEFVLFRRGSLSYERNPYLDRDEDGVVTKGEVITALRGVLERGLAQD